jgi:hypothetical protein
LIATLRVAFLFMLSVTFFHCYAEHHIFYSYAEHRNFYCYTGRQTFCYAECHIFYKYTECRLAECRGTVFFDNPINEEIF